jgi:hypothetical protein
MKCSGSGLVAVETARDKYRKLPACRYYRRRYCGAAFKWLVCIAVFRLLFYDNRFEARSQGYGLTLQQASKAIKGLGIASLESGVVSTKHSS